MFRVLTRFDVQGVDSFSQRRILLLFSFQTLVQQLVFVFEPLSQHLQGILVRRAVRRRGCQADFRFGELRLQLLRTVFATRKGELERFVARTCASRTRWAAAAISLLASCRSASSPIRASFCASSYSEPSSSPALSSRDFGKLPPSSLTFEAERIRSQKKSMSLGISPALRFGSGRAHWLRRAECPGRKTGVCRHEAKDPAGVRRLCASHRVRHGSFGGCRRKSSEREYRSIRSDHNGIRIF